MGEVKRITIPVDEDFKARLELIAKGQRRSLSANLEHALEVYAALFDKDGKMLVPIDAILMGDLSSLGNIKAGATAPVTEDKPKNKVEGLEKKDSTPAKKEDPKKEEEQDLNELLKNVDEDMEVPEL